MGAAKLYIMHHSKLVWQNKNNNLFIMCAACRHGSKAGVTETYEGHQAPVTAIDTHKVQEGIDLSHLFLTSSFDWTVKLWNLKVSKK